MFTPDTFIDSFQTGKKLFTNKFITEPTFNKVAHNYIDAQTAFAKMLTKNTLDVAQYTYGVATRSFYPSTVSDSVEVEKKEVKARKTSKAKVAEAENTDINTQGE